MSVGKLEFLVFCVQVKPHQCDVCGNAFSLARNLSRHMLLHTNSRLTCSLVSNTDCAFVTTRLDKLRTHLIKKHNIKTQASLKLDDCLQTSPNVEHNVPSVDIQKKDAGETNKQAEPPGDNISCSDVTDTQLGNLVMSQELNEDFIVSGEVLTVSSQSSTTAEAAQLTLSVPRSSTSLSTLEQRAGSHAARVSEVPSRRTRRKPILQPLKGTMKIVCDKEAVVICANTKNKKKCTVRNRTTRRSFTSGDSLNFKQSKEIKVYHPPQTVLQAPCPPAPNFCAPPVPGHSLSGTLLSDVRVPMHIASSEVGVGLTLTTSSLSGCWSGLNVDVDGSHAPADSNALIASVITADSSAVPNNILATTFILASPKLRENNTVTNIDPNTSHYDERNITGFSTTNSAPGSSLPSMHAADLDSNVSSVKVNLINPITEVVITELDPINKSNPNRPTEALNNFLDKCPIAQEKQKTSSVNYKNVTHCLRLGSSNCNLASVLQALGKPVMDPITFDDCARQHTPRGQHPESVTNCTGADQFITSSVALSSSSSAAQAVKVVDEFCQQITIVDDTRHAANVPNTKTIKLLGLGDVIIQTSEEDLQFFELHDRELPDGGNGEICALKPRLDSDDAVTQPKPQHDSDDAVNSTKTTTR